MINLFVCFSFQSTPIDPESGHSVHEGTDYLEKPRFLQAITENNSPRYDWGPKKSANHYGLYSHLRKKPFQNKNNNNDVSMVQHNDQIHSNGFINDEYQKDFDDDQISNLRETKF